MTRLRPTRKQRDDDAKTGLHDYCPLLDSLSRLAWIQQLAIGNLDHGFSDSRDYRQYARDLEGSILMPKMNESKTLRTSHGGTSKILLHTAFEVSNRKEAQQLGAKIRSRYAQWFKGARVEEVVTGGFAGRSFIERIETQMDNRRKAMEETVIKLGAEAAKSIEWQRNRGRYEGFGQSLALLRSSSLRHEIERSNDRLGLSED